MNSPRNKPLIALLSLLLLIPILLSACQPEATPTPTETGSAPQNTPTDAAASAGDLPVAPEGNDDLPITSPASLTRLTETPGDEYHTVWSPDGEWLLFTYNDGGAMSIGTYNVPGQTWELSNASLDGDLYLEWSADGTQFTFDAYAEDGRSAIYLADFSPDITSPLVYQKLAIPSPAFMSSLSPDGASVLVYYDNQLNLFDRETEALTPISGTESCWHPKFSPDGSRILYTTTTAEGQDIFGLSLTDGSIEKLTDSSADFDRAQWSPDGNQIAYVAELDGGSEIWLTDIASGFTVRLVSFMDEADNEVTMPEFSPDGQSLVISYQGDLWLVDLSGINWN
jgi:Tol biopolymer transport system component